MHNETRNTLWNILSVLTAEERPDWDKVSQSWVGALLDCDSESVEKMVFKLGDPLRRRQRTSLIADIDKLLAVLAEADGEDLSDARVAA